MLRRLESKTIGWGTLRKEYSGCLRVVFPSYWRSEQSLALQASDRPFTSDEACREPCQAGRQAD